MLPVTKKRNPLVSDYTVYGRALEKVSSAKYLVVELTEHLNLGKHIHAATDKAIRASCLQLQELERMTSHSPLTLLTRVWSA